MEVFPPLFPPPFFKHNCLSRPQLHCEIPLKQTKKWVICFDLFSSHRCRISSCASGVVSLHLELVAGNPLLPFRISPQILRRRSLQVAVRSILAAMSCPMYHARILLRKATACQYHLNELRGRNIFDSLCSTQSTEYKAVVG